ncbi:MAG TPA: carbohydrate ABC transporter permease [Candidatus Alectryocaccomicrobium excrementavium]|uniref:Carbohydrate ABC transporter permease n=1 Tax=Candidatus Alectryocaccomicrobium excrementavium TaxID=2840668 RepID=A0A9D1K711_9FIRM|nr:carbohydrate ABC transporter permease [Candidatus Alectryocaccomicrobium excrementavium]
MKVKRSYGERIGYAIILIVMITYALTTLYPFWHVLMYSISDSGRAMTGGLFFLPRGVSLLSYRTVFQTHQIFVAYRNTILKTVVGTVLSLIITALTAFPLSIRRLRGRNAISMYIFFTMLFSGGMIPTFLVVQNLGMIDTFWALIIPGLMSAYNMFIMRNYFQQLPPELEESAYIDGATPPVVLAAIILPVSTPCLAAVAMFYAVGNWNSYLDCLLYTNSGDLQVLQIYLRNLIDSAGAMDAIASVSGDSTHQLSAETVKMTTIAVSILPILILYPFLQKFYTKGVTTGAVKG